MADQINDAPVGDHGGVRVCSVGSCKNVADDPRYKKCSPCRAYMREYKRRRRHGTQAKIAAGLCTRSDCTNPADEGKKSCSPCREREKKRQSASSTYNARHKAMRDRIKAACLDHYGRACVCCTQTCDALLTIDHEDGSGSRHKTEGGTRRRGHSLYSWLRRREFPEGFRTLCHTCNFTLGHFGYCPHGDLTQTCRVGKPPSKFGAGAAELRATRRVVNQRNRRKIKIEVFEAYGGVRCACPCGCTEDNHECLSIDHTDQKGADHREELTGDRRNGTDLYGWLKRNGYPEGFRVLCHNCNWGTGADSVCPLTT